MSEYWNLHCYTCDATGPISNANHAGRYVAQLVQHLPVFAALGRAGFKVSDQSIDFGTANGLAEWAVLHEGHDVRSRSEYGHVYGGCLRMASCASCGHRRPCVLLDGHSGECDWEHR